MRGKGQKNRIILVPGRIIWPHEMRVAQILSMAGHRVEFLSEGNLPTPDIKLDGIEYEIKSPESSNVNTLKHMIKKATYQSPNLIIDASRLKGMTEKNFMRFLVAEIKAIKQIKRMILITKSGKIIDIFSLIW